MARKRNTRRNSARRNQKQSSGIPKWLWMLMGIAVGVVITYSGAILDLINKTPSATPAAPAVVETEIESKKEPAKKEQKETEVLTLVPPAEPPKYDFYTRLPKDEVIIPERDYREYRKPKAPLQDNAQAPKPAHRDSSSAQTGKYLIQVGSFRNKKDAERRKATLLLQGMQPRVESVTTDSGKWYRVRLGPFTSLDKVNQLRTELSSQKVKTLLVNISGQ